MTLTSKANRAAVEGRHLVLVLVQHDAVRAVAVDVRLGEGLPIGRGRHAEAVALT